MTIITNTEYNNIYPYIDINIVLVYTYFWYQFHLNPEPDIGITFAMSGDLHILLEQKNTQT